MNTQFYPEQERHLKRFCRYLSQLLKCAVQPPESTDNGFFIAQVDTSPFMEDVLFKREDKGLSPIIPLIFSGWHTFDVKETLALHASLTRVNPIQSIAVLILFGEQNIIDSAKPIIVDKMRAYGIDIIVMGRQELEEVLDSHNPPSAFRSFLLSRINITRISPYEIAGPVSNFVFSGREIELRTIAEGIRKRSYFLIGGRRFGKTSILFRLNLFRLPAMGFYTIYHNFQSTPSTEEFLQAKIHKWQPQSPVDSPLTFADLLDHRSNVPFVVLLLDEAGELIPDDQDNEWRLFGKLRALANSGYVQVVLSGERALRETIRDSSSPFFNFADELTVGPLDSRAAEELIIRPMKQLEVSLIKEKEIAHQIYEFTSGHPNIIQRLCRRLVERIGKLERRRITLGDVRAVIEDPDFQRDDFLSTYLERATPLEKIISLLMADNSKIRTLQSTQQALKDRCDLQPSARKIDDALQRLVDLRSILKRTPSGYKFAVKAFPRVVAGTMTLTDMLMIFAEEYEEQDT
jgi:hypothetical protein